MKNILIIGSGFMGTSIALAVGNRNTFCVEEHSPFKDFLIERDIYKNIYSSLDEVGDKEFELIIICSRQKSVPDKIKEVSKKYPSSIITEISSSKNFLKKHNMPENFISSHPICGSHNTGPQYSDGELFKNKEVIVISNPNKFLSEKIELFWNSIGAKVTYMDIDEHNKIYAFLSHFPHYFSFIYKKILEEEKIDYKRLSGDSLKEILRLSESDKDLWNEIFSDNKENLDFLVEKVNKYLK